MSGPLATALLALVFAGCASAYRPSPSAVAVELEPGSAVALRVARAVWVEGASSRTGALASGLAAAVDGGTPVAAVESTAVRENLLSAVRKVRGLELASARDHADLVLYFEQADRLRCGGCRQPEDLWYWWGLVADRSGRELASLHGETTAGPESAARQFVKSVRSLARRSRGGGG